MARRNEALRARMREMLAEQESSGLNAARFARERGMSPWTLYKWKRRLEEIAAEEQPRRDGFVEVKVVGVERRPPAMTVELGRGLCVHVPYGFEEAELRRLLAVLSSC